MDFKDIIYSRRKKLNLRLEDIAEICGVNKTTVQRWESGEIKNVRGDKIANLAKALHTTPAYIMGWTDDDTEDDELSDVFSIKGVLPLPHATKKPRLGTVACGEPILAQENIEDYDDVPEDIKCDFTLLCEGDSMINARIYNNDIVYIRKQPQVENGEIAACLIEGEFETKATLKRFYKYDDKIILQAENPKYPPLVYVNEEMNKVRVIGKAVGFTSKL